MLPTSILQSIALAAFSFLMAGAILAIITAFILEALYENGLRETMQRSWLRSWFARVASTPSLGEKVSHETVLQWSKQAVSEVEAWQLNEKADVRLPLRSRSRDSIVALPFPQLCAQLALRAQHIVTTGKKLEFVRLLESAGDYEAPASGTASVLPNESAELTRSAAVDRAIDRLQLTFAMRWRRLDYALSFALALTLLVLLAWLVGSGRTESSTMPAPVYFAIALLAMVLVPFARLFVERASASRY